MSNPLRMFRKYQATFLVAFGVVLMFAFVVGPIVSDYLSSSAGQGGGKDDWVVKWKGQELRESNIADLRTVHLLTARFLRELISRVIVMDNGVIVERQGQKIELIKHRTYRLVDRGFDDSGQMVFRIVVDGEIVSVPRTKKDSTEPQVQPIGSQADLIAEATGEEDLVRRLLLAEEARQQGVVIGVDAVMDYLDNLCNATEETRPDYAAMLRTSTSGRLDIRRFIEHLSTELAARRMLIMSNSGLVPTPPEVIYQCYNKLNRHISAELLAVDVDEFSDKVGDPKEDEIVALYEEGKDRFPIPTSPEPAFKQRKRIKFQYVMGVFDEFLQREVDQIGPTIADEDIEKYYEENKEQFKIVELPESEPTEDPKMDDDTEGSKDDPNGEDLPAEIEPAKKEPAETTSAKTEPVKPAKKNPAKVEPAKTEPGKTEPAKTESAKTESAKTESSKTESSKTEAGKAEPEKTDGTDDQTSAASNSVTFVSYQQASGQNEPAKEAASGDALPPVAPGTTQEKSKQADAKPEAKAEATSPPEARKAETAIEGTAEGEPKSDTEDTGAKEEPKEKPAQYKPLDDELRADIRERIARQQARPVAHDKLEQAMEQVRTQVEQYSRDLSLARAIRDAEKDEEKAPGVLERGPKDPPPPDLKAIAKEHQLSYGETPPWDMLDVSVIRQADPTDDDPPYGELARATETVWSQANQFRRSLIDVGFTGDSELYEPKRLVDGIVMQGAFPIPPQKLFLFWGVREVREKVPELKEVRSEVIKAWKRKQALPLAQAEAERMAQKVSRADQPLAEVFPDSADKVIRTIQFSWMTRGSMPGGTGGRPMLSPVNGTTNGQPVNVSGAGNDFMRSVFALKVGEAGTATNEPHSFVYVVRVDSEDLTDEERRQAFYITGLTPEVSSLVDLERMDIVYDWLDGLEEVYDVQWNRDPDNDWRFQQ